MPPYLKDRRSSRHAFRSSQSGSLPAITSAQRFEPLQHARRPITSSIPQSMQGPAVAPVAAMASAPSNVVPLHRMAEEAHAFAPLGDESTIQEAWQSGRNGLATSPNSTASARERRRQVLLTLTGAAFVTLLLALALRGNWIALNIGIDAVLVGYVVLLVRFRQMASDRRTKIEPIRPAVTERRPVTVQAAPDYLLRSGT